MAMPMEVPRYGHSESVDNKGAKVHWKQCVVITVTHRKIGNLFRPIVSFNVGSS